MAERRTLVQVPDRRDDDPPATPDQLQSIRQLVAGMSLQGFRFDYRKLGQAQAQSIIQQLQQMSDTQDTPQAPRKAGPGCLASLMKNLVMFVLLAALGVGAVTGGYWFFFIYQKDKNNTQTADAKDPEKPDTQAKPNAAAPNPGTNNPGSDPDSFELFRDNPGKRDTPSDKPGPLFPPDNTDKPDPKDPVDPPTPPATDPALNAQLLQVELLLAQITVNTHPSKHETHDIRSFLSKRMFKKLSEQPKAMQAIEKADPALAKEIRALVTQYGEKAIDYQALGKQATAARKKLSEAFELKR